MRKCKEALAPIFGISARCGWRSTFVLEEGWWRWWRDGGSAVMQRNRRGCDQGTCILLIRVRLLAILAFSDAMEADRAGPQSLWDV